MQWWGILLCTGILRFHSTNPTSQDFAHHKRRLKNIKTDASVLRNTVLCLCLRKILYHAWACSICRNQFQLWFPKPFYWNSKKHEGKAAHLAEFWNWLLCQMPAVLSKSGVRFIPVRTSLCIASYFCFRDWVIFRSLVLHEDTWQTNLKPGVTPYEARNLLKYQKLSLKVCCTPTYKV